MYMAFLAAKQAAFLLAALQNRRLLRSLTLPSKNENLLSKSRDVSKDIINSGAQKNRQLDNIGDQERAALSQFLSENQ